MRASAPARAAVSTALYIYGDIYSAAVLVTEPYGIFKVFSVEVVRIPSCIEILQSKIYGIRAAAQCRNKLFFSAYGSQDLRVSVLHCLFLTMSPGSAPSGRFISIVSIG